MKENLFGERLKELRIQDGLTLEQLGKLTSIHFSTIGYWEKGTKDNPTAKALIALADYFDVSVDYLLGRKEDF